MCTEQQRSFEGIVRGEGRKVLDIIIGITVIAFCLGGASVLVLYSRRQINRIARMKRSTYRDIMQGRYE